MKASSSVVLNSALTVTLAAVCAAVLGYVALSEHVRAFDALREADAMRAETESVYRTIGRHVDSAYRCQAR